MPYPLPASVPGTRGRILDLIRRSRIGATDLAERLDLTYNAVRVHLAALERDGLIRIAGMQRGTTRPRRVYELAPGVEDALSRAYVPFAVELVRTLAERLPEEELDDIMETVGRRLAAGMAPVRGSLLQRVASASRLLEELGAPNAVERTNGEVRIRGFGCLLAAAVQDRPQVCRAMESLLTELLDAPVGECCERGEQPRCCFAVGGVGTR